MELNFTAGGARVLKHAARQSGDRSSAVFCVNDLLAALLSEPECLACEWLREYGITSVNDLTEDSVDGNAPERSRSNERGECGTRNGHNTHGEIVAVSTSRFQIYCDDQPLEINACWSCDVEAMLGSLTRLVREFPEIELIATEHLLWAITGSEQPTGHSLRASGVTPDAIRLRLLQQHGYAMLPNAEPLKMPDDEPCDVSNTDIHDVSEIADVTRPPRSCPRDVHDDSSDAAVVRIIDAAANRAREGLRVVEDYVRFVLDDRHLTQLMKQLRHDLAASFEQLAAGQLTIEQRLTARDTQRDVGTSTQTVREYERNNPADVLTANFMRLQESLRSIEEYGKTIDPNFAAQVEQARYRTYTLHKAVAATLRGRRSIGDRRLYVLIDGCETLQQFEQLVDSLIRSGKVDMIQLRDKRLTDRQLLIRARFLRSQIDQARTSNDVSGKTCGQSEAVNQTPLFMMNDRPDLARLARADGVHVGQDELSINDVRAIVGHEMLVGVSTHSIQQARQAVLDGADYIGVGPTFRSETKQFEADEFTGLELLRQVADEIRLPAFAIGGINFNNVEQVTKAGMRRIAVAGAITRSEDPANIADRLQTKLLPNKDRKLKTEN